MRLPQSMFSIPLVLLVSLALSESADVPSPNKPNMGCVSGWTLFGDSCYIVERDNLLEYGKAQDKCHELGAELANASSKNARDLSSALISTGATPGYWIVPRQRHTWYDDCVLLVSPPGTDQKSCSSKLGYICETHLVNLTERYADCPQGTFGWRNRCYSLNTETETFSTAQARCESNKGNLASVPDEETRHYLISEFQGQVSSIWTGLYKGDDNDYKFKAGDEVQYLPWKAGHHGTEPEQCIYIEPESTFFQPTECSETLPSVCEYLRNTQASSSTSIPDLQECFPGMETFGDFCYMVYHQDMTWFEAHDYCRQKDSDIVSVHSPEEAELVKSMAITSSLQTQSNLEPFWLGFANKRPSGDYNDNVWADGTAFDYSNWNVSNTCGINQFFLEINFNTMEWTCVKDSGVFMEYRPFVCKQKKGEVLSPATTVSTPGVPSQKQGYTSPKDPKYSMFTTPKNPWIRQSLNDQFGVSIGQRLDTLPDIIASRARLAISDILSLAEQIYIDVYHTR